MYWTVYCANPHCTFGKIQARALQTIIHISQVLQHLCMDFSMIIWPYFGVILNSLRRVFLEKSTFSPVHNIFESLCTFVLIVSFLTRPSLSHHFSHDHNFNYILYIHISVTNVDNLWSMEENEVSTCR